MLGSVQWMISDRVGSKTSIDEHLANNNDVLEVLDSSSRSALRSHEDAAKEVSRTRIPLRSCPNRVHHMRACYFTAVLGERGGLLLDRRRRDTEASRITAANVVGASEYDEGFESEV
jgi:hypothetical protein